MRFVFSLLVLAILLIVPTVFAAQNANIDIQVSPQTLYTNGPATKSVTFHFSHQFDGTDGPAIDQVDAYLLDLNDSKITYQNQTGSGWSYEHISIYNDEHFLIKNAWDQNLVIQFNFTGSTEGEYLAQGYYQFYDNDGATTGLGDNRPYYPLLDLVDHTAFKIVVDKTSPVVSLGNPVFNSSGLKIDGNIIEQNPLASLVLTYNKPNNTTATIILPAAKDFNYTIPLTDLAEGTTLTYTITATDAASNNGNGSKNVTVNDVPQFQGVGPSTILPDTNLSLLATVTDASGIKDVSLRYQVNGGAIQTVAMALDLPPTVNRWTIDLPSFPAGSVIDYNLVARDQYDNAGYFNGSFAILRSFDVNFLVLDFFTQLPVSNVTLTVSGRTINTGSTTFVIPPKNFVFNQTITIPQWEGTYSFQFSNPNYSPTAVLLNISGPTNKTVYLGGVSNAVTRADIIPKITDGNQSFILNFEVEFNERVPIQDAFIRYSIGNAAFDQTVQLEEGNDGVYRATLGPFQDQIILYSRVESTDIGDQLLVFDLGIRWYNLLNVLTGTLPEICENGVDDNNNGLIDEGCTCPVVGDTRNCSNNTGTCREGFQRCGENGKWGNQCENGITPIREICGNKQDEDCDGVPDDGCELDSDRDGLLDAEELTITTDPFEPDTDGDNVTDGQEFLYDNTDPKDPAKNLLVIDLKNILSAGETQFLQVRHPQVGVVEDVTFVVESPNGQQTQLLQKGKNAIGYLALETGTFTVRASKKNFSQVKPFETQGTFLTPVINGLGNGVGFIFGEKALELPLNFLFLILLGIIISVLSRDLFKIWHREKVLSSTEERTRTLLGIAFIGIVSLLPLVFFRLFGFEIALTEAFATIILIFALAQMIRRQQQKTIRVG